MTAEQAAKRVIELSQKATSGPWMVHHVPDSIYGSSVLNHNGGRLFESTSYGKMRLDADFIAETRSLAPKLAEAFLIAMEHIKALKDQLTPGLADLILRNIEKTFVEEK